MTARGASALLLGVVVAGAIGPLCAQGRVIAADGPPAWGTKVRLVPALTIGTLDGPAEYAFGSVSAVVGFADGSFVVHDSRQRQVRRYDAAGRFTANIGRVRSVSTNVGATEFTRIACGASSTAIAFVSPSSACFVMQ